MSPVSAEPRILVVDDEQTNVLLLARLLEAWGYTDVLTTTDSTEVLQIVERSGPDLVLLDLQMPYPDGFELLTRLRAGDGYLAIIVLTADVTRETRDRALGLGASDFLTKPFDSAEVRLRVGNLLQMGSVTKALAGANERLERTVRRRTRELEIARVEVLERLALAAEYRDDDTNEHAERVGRSAGEIARAYGRGAAETERIRRAAPLHDVGKLGIPDAILLKPGRLDRDEYELMKTHAEVGGKILSGSRSRLLQMAERIARTHHERWDGTGYPCGYVGQSIPFVGRVVAVADVFDALTHDRPYKAAWPVADALTEIESGAGSHFDPEIVSTFLELDHEALLGRVGAAVKNR